MQVVRKLFTTSQRPLLALVAGLMLAAAFPRPSVAGFAWIAPGLLLFAAMGQGGKSAFRLGWLGGLAFNLTALYWLLYMPVTGLPILAWLALSAYCALYVGWWTWLSWRMFPVKSSENSLSQFAALNWPQRAAWVLGCAALWTALEFMLGRFLTGFPWLALGVSQYKMLPLIQIASVTGVAGVTFLAVWFSVSLGCALLCFAHEPKQRSVLWREILPAALAVAGVVAFGMNCFGPQKSSAKEIKIALVQPSIPQTLIWNARENTNRFQQIIELSRVALQSQPDVLLWPEAAVPGFLRYDEFVGRGVSELAREHHVWMMLGADDAEARMGENSNAADYFNACFLVTPEGKLAERYIKRRLVIFGEYVPLARWLPFLRKLTPIEGGFVAGEKVVPFEMLPLRDSGGRAKAGMLICFEDVFADVARESAQADTDFLVNLTNDGWFSESAEQWQHAAHSVFRAVENGLPVVRCANNGLTCWVDARGRMHEVFFPDDFDIYRAGFKIARLPLLAADARRVPTFYQQHGEWFAWLCVMLSVGMIVKIFVRRRA